MFLQMKKLISSHQSKVKTVDVECQTTLINQSPQVPDIHSTSTDHSDEIARLIHYLLCELYNDNPTPYFFNAIISSFSIVEKSCKIHATTSPTLRKLYQNASHLFAQLIYSRMKLLPAYEV
jgi:galactose-1-phosphate uridylyltransferase